jgi:hypothetical protein
MCHADVIEGAFGGRHFTPAAGAFARNFHEDHPAFLCNPEAGFEWSDQRHPDFSQRNAIEFHSFRI